MTYKSTLLFLSLLCTQTAFANPDVDAKLAGADKNICQFDIKFSSEPQQKSQTVNLSPTVTMQIEQFVTTQVKDNAKIASNVMCQNLTGHAYTGSKQEWANFIDNGVKGLLNAGFKDLQFTRVGTDDATYKGDLANMEYIFTGDNDGNKQIIHNLAVLDKSNNQVITISVSGNEKVANEIKTEYQNLVNSFTP
ncbi:hypothetical protein NQT69_15790 [Pseudoalteromonas shioyasakiensis]|uniref:hypothetical protein n=1 Tax=Pseudoalteromonas shioyasakiensis TaxID=1190813 RepID=UPI002117F00E|nr:hypothetical protein [Pseudoalteromonas shioyasakiensis]MCQ8879463.1 hypothetical protein [Pseudoalteromonas shioyasakiensis]